MAKPIKSLNRGLEVLDALLSGPMTTTLDRLHRATQIPKSSLASLLESMRQCDVVEKRGEAWFLTAEWLLKAQAHTIQRLLELDSIRRRNGTTK